MTDQTILHRGVHLPKWEKHLQTLMQPKAKRYMQLPDGRSTYQRHKYLAALEFIPADQRVVFVDAGAHVGLWSMQAELDFEEIVAFEPHPVHADIYPLNMRTEKYTLHRVALGDREDQIGLGIEQGSSGGTYVIDNGGYLPMDTLDSFKLPRIDFLKIDVEGYELPMLQGAEETLKRTRPVVMVEQKGRDQSNFRQARNGGLEFLFSLGMKELRAPISGDYFLGW